MNKNRLILSVFFILAVLALGWALFQGEESVNLSQPKEVEISKGMSFDEVSSELKARDIISSKTVFKIYGALSGSFDKIKPGRYFLSKDIEISRLMKILVDGPEEISIIIPSGLTLAEIDDKLSVAAVIKPGELINFNVDNLRKDYSWLPAETNGAVGGPLEGFLMPDTYKFFSGADVDLVARIFLDNFYKNVISAGGLAFFCETR